jgi:hypothetical protein
VQAEAVNTTLPAAWAELARKEGGVGKLAKALGVSPRTLCRWGKGKQPQPIVQQYVTDFAKKRGVDITWGKAPKGRKA